MSCNIFTKYVTSCRWSNAPFLIAYCTFFFGHWMAKIGGQMYDTNTVRNYSNARREIYLVYTLIKVCVQALIIIWKTSSFRLKRESLCNAVYETNREMENGNIFAFSQIWDKNALNSFWIISPVPSGYARLIRMDDAKSTPFFINRQRDTAPPQKWHDTFWSFSENQENASNHKMHVRFVIIKNFSFDSSKSRIGSDEKPLFPYRSWYSSHWNQTNLAINTPATKTEWNLKFQRKDW